MFVVCWLLLFVCCLFVSLIRLLYGVRLLFLGSHCLLIVVVVRCFVLVVC